MIHTQLLAMLFWPRLVGKRRRVELATRVTWVLTHCAQEEGFLASVRVSTDADARDEDTARSAHGLGLARRSSTAIRDATATCKSVEHM